jgi:hypothetical protein
MPSLSVIEAVGVAILIGVAALLFHLYSQQLTLNGSLQQSNAQLQQAQKDQANALKQRSTVEQKNSSATYPALIDKLR